MLLERSMSPLELTNEYLDHCHLYPGSASAKTVKQHIRYFFEQSHLPKAWAYIVKKRLGPVDDLEMMRMTISRLEPILATIADC